MKENWSKDRMMNLLYRNGKTDQPKGKPHKLLDINEIPPDKRSRFFDSKGKGGEFWHGWNVLLGNIKIKWTK